MDLLAILKPIFALALMVSFFFGLLALAVYISTDRRAEAAAKPMFREWLSLFMQMSEEDQERELIILRERVKAQKR